MNLENIKASERSQTPETTYYMIPLYDMSRTSKSIETESRFMVARGWSLGKMKRGGGRFRKGTYS